jgi:cytochrome oxidase Cu insertion factor (SCO1/SenC/PrrC family)
MRRLLWLPALIALCAFWLGGTAGVQAHDPADLEIGKLAPEIEGEDIDGVPFKLSDYRGKVVVLDFWGDW